MTTDHNEAMRLAEWLQQNSSGVYRPAAEAADLLTRQAAELDTLRAEVERLTKPFGESHLVSLIEAAIQGHASTREAMRWFAGQITPKAARTHKETE